MISQSILDKYNVKSLPNKLYRGDSDHVRLVYAGEHQVRISIPINMREELGINPSEGCRVEVYAGNEVILIAPTNGEGSDTRSMSKFGQVSASLRHIVNIQKGHPVLLFSTIEDGILVCRIPVAIQILDKAPAPRPFENITASAGYTKRFG